MNRLLSILATLAALLGAAPFIRPRTSGAEVFLWVPKLLGGALSPVSGAIGVIAAVAGLARRDWKLAGTGLAGAALAMRLGAELPDVDEALAALPGAGAEAAERVSAGPAGGGVRPEFERNVVVGHNPESGRAVRADLWPPTPGRPRSGLGLIYAHGSGWRVGDKDQGTRTFFRRLAGHGHLVLDIAYDLWPAASLPSMVNEINQAILWLKENGPGYGIDPDRIVLMGGSAGGHLALMAAYSRGHPAFRPAGAEGDTSVRGVIAFYPPADLLAFEEQHTGLEDEGSPSSPRLSSLTALVEPFVERISQAVVKQIFTAKDQAGRTYQSENIVAQMLGGTAEEIPDTYRLMSPSTYVSAECPPTLLLQGSDDVFGLAPAVRRLNTALRAAGVPAVLIEFPHTEHGFDLLLPQISPPARAATRAVERFLDHLA